MFTKAIILALAAVAVAIPNSGSSMHSGSRMHSESHTESHTDSCGSNSTVHCCNGETSDKIVGYGFLPIGAEVLDLKNLLGQCNDITVTVLAGAVPFRNKCKQQAVCCGEMKQEGVVNFGCTPFQVL